jgi:hypothetical protein
MLVGEIHVVGIPPAEVEALSELRSLSILWRWASGDVVDDWAYRLNGGRDLDVGMMDVDRYVGSSSESCAWIFCPVVCTAEGYSLWVVEVVHASEERAETILLWLDHLLTTKDLLEEEEFLVFAWVFRSTSERRLEHLNGVLLSKGEALDVWLDLGCSTIANGE